MSEKPTREEMIQMVAHTRTQVTNATVTPEEMAAHPVAMTELEIPTRVGPSRCFLAKPRPEAVGLPLVLNLHGGGFIRGRTPNDELFCRKLCRAMDCAVLDVDYRLAPEHPFPEGFHECLDVAIWARTHAAELGGDPEQLIFCGHSAGGNFVFGIAMALQATGQPQPLCIISEYPPLDVATDPGQKPQRGQSIPVERAKLYNLYYCDEELQRDPYASPYFATEAMLQGLPQTLVITAGEDSLCTEAEEFALKLARAGSEVTLKRFPHVGHAFTIYRKPGFEAAMELIFRYLRQVLNR